MDRYDNVHSHHCQRCATVVQCFNPKHFNHKTDALVVPFEVNNCDNCKRFSDREASKRRKSAGSYTAYIRPDPEYK